MAEFFNYVDGATKRRIKSRKNMVKKDKAGNINRSSEGLILDREQYVPNDSITDEMLARAKAFCRDRCRVWEVEKRKVGAKDIIRWVTNQEINTFHVEELIWFYTDDPDFRVRIVELHTGAHCTSDGNIGTAHAAFSLADT